MGQFPWRRFELPVVAILVVFLAAAGFWHGIARPITQLTVLGGSELKPLFADGSEFTQRLRRELGIELTLKPVGSLDGADRIARGEQYDLAWFASDTYLKLVGQRTGQQFRFSDPVMESPVILAVKHEVARRFGWAPNSVVDWSSVVDHAARGEFRYAMTDAAQSNSGFSALVAVATSTTAATGDAGGQPAKPLCGAEGAASPQLQGFFFGNRARTPSSGDLDRQYLDNQDQLDGIINYEAELLELQHDPGLRTGPLDLVYPRGAVYADYPLTLTNAARNHDYDRLVSWLHSSGIQHLLTTSTARRPVSGTEPSAAIPLVNPPRTQLPCDIPTIEALLNAYLDKFQGPSRTYYVLDVSQSMGLEQRIENLSQALVDLTGGGATLASQFLRFRAEEQVTVIPFASTVLPGTEFVIPTPDKSGPVLEQIRAYARSLRPDTKGGTSLYGAVLAAYQAAQDAAAGNERYATSIVLMSDGENNQPPKLDEFRRQLPPLREGISGVHTFAIKFGSSTAAPPSGSDPPSAAADPVSPPAGGETACAGEASGVPDLQAVAKETGGRFFCSDPSSLSEVLRLIRGYR